MYHTYFNVDYRKVAVGITIAMLLATMVFAVMPVALALKPCDGADFGEVRATDGAGNAGGNVPEGHIFGTGGIPCGSPP